MQEHSAPHAQYQNGVVERHIQTIEDRASAILINSGLPKHFWGEAIQTAAATWNVTTNRDESPYEMVMGRQPDLKLMKPFGCRVYVRTPNVDQHHMERRAEPGVFIGYEPGAKGYRIAKDGRAKTYVIRSPRDCTFKENIFPYKSSVPVDHPRSEVSHEEIIDFPTFWTPSSQKIDGPTQPDDDVPIGPTQPDQVESPPSTPPLVLDDRYFPSTFEKDVALHPRSGLRSGKQYLPENVHEMAINMIENKTVPERNAIDDIIVDCRDDPIVDTSSP